MSGYLLLYHKSRMGPKPTADKKVKNCVQLFIHRKGRAKTNSINVRIVESQAGDWCNEANISVTSAIKQILVLLVQ